MDGRKRSRAFSKTVYSVQKRFLAFLLAATMILTNVGVDLNTAYAASSSESVTFEMSGSQLVDAIEEAIVDGNEVTSENLSFTNGKIAEFEKLFFGGEGTVYEVFPEPDGGSMDAELRVFVRLPEDADDMYMVTGDEEVIFLYVNNGEDTISCTTEITRMDDGVEKAKKTKRVTVKSYEAAYGDEEVNLISRPAEETTAPEEPQGPADEGATSEAESQVETTAPSEDGSAVVPDETDGTIAAPDETDEATSEPEKDTAASDEGEAAESEDSQTEVETEKAATEDAEEKTHEEDEPKETEAPETEAPEKAEPVASVIRHFAPVVAEHGDDKAADADEPEEEADAPKEKEETVKDKADAVEDNKETAEEKATEASETSETAETKENQDGTTEGAVEETSTAAGDDAAVPDTDESMDESAEAPSESSTSAVDNSGDVLETPSGSGSVPDTATSSDARETTGAVNPEDSVSKAGTSDLVGMGYCSTAKVYTTTVNQLKALEDFDGYKVSYAFYPEASGRIVEGPRGVEEGNTLTFGVKNQIGYAVESVDVNGEIFEADFVADNDDGSQTAWYSVPEVYEEQEVEVYMTETGEHPEFFAELPMEDGTIIHLYAPEGVLPPNVKAVASVVTGIEDVVKENIEADAAASGEEKEVIASLSYNIDLLDVSGHKLDDGIWSGAVLVTFTGAPIEKNSKAADSVEVVYVATTKEDEVQAEIDARDVIAVETVTDAIDVAGEQTVSEVVFEAEHFSVYTVTFSNTNSGEQNTIRFIPYISDTDAEIKPNGNDKTGQYDLSFGLFSEETSISIGDISTKMSAALGIDTNVYKFDKAVLSTNPNIVITDIGYTRDWGIPPQNYKFVYSTDNTRTWTGFESGSTIKMLYNETRLTITFDKNGGSGSVPAAVAAKAGEQVVMPSEGNLRKDNQVFVGWSRVKNANAKAMYKPGNNGTVYPAGSVYNMLDKNVTLYATWANTDVRAEFYIRLDGKIPTEPQGHASSEYTGAIGIDRAIKVATFYTDSTDGVERRLNSWPTDNQIQAVVTKYNDNHPNKKISYDKDKQYVLWYVIKAEDTWHVDGVLLDREKVNLSYSPNCAPGTWSNMPDGKQYEKGAMASVSGEIPVRTGYSFAAWNTDAEGTGVFYSPGDVFSIHEDTTLYAQWTKNEHGVTYIYSGDKPANVAPAPARQSYPYDGVVKVDAKYKANDTLSDARGVWTFRGWETEDVQVKDGTFAMPDQDVVFTGIWELTTVARYSLEVTYKEVTVDKNGKVTEVGTISGPDCTEYTYGEEYSVTKRDPDGFTYVDTIGKVSGTVTDHVEVVFRYTRNKYNISVIYTEVTVGEGGTVTEVGTISGPDIMEHAYGTDYTVTKADPDGFTYVDTLGTASGTLTGPVDIVFRYTRNKYNVSVKYTEVTVAEDGAVTEVGTISGPDRTEHVYGDHYAVTKSDPTGFTYVDTLGKTSGTVSGNVDVEFRYTRNKYNVSVKYTEVTVGEGGKLIEVGTISGPDRTEYAYGADYSVSKDDPKGFTYVDTLGAVSGTVTGNVDVEFRYTRNQYTVQIVYTEVELQSDGAYKEIGNISNPTTEVYAYGEPYSVEKADPTGFTYVDTRGITSGILTGPVDVEFRYTRNNYNVSVKYTEVTVDDDGNVTEVGTISGPDRTEYAYGSDYTVTKANPDGFTYVDTIGETSGIVTGNVEVEFRYTRNNYNVSVKYTEVTVDDDGNVTEVGTISGPDRTEYAYGSDYTVTKANPDGFTYVDTIGETSGIVTGNVEVEFRYTRNNYNVSVKYTEVTVDDDGNVTEVGTISGPDRTEYAYGADYSVTKADPDGFTYVDTTGTPIGTVTSDVEIEFRYTRNSYRYIVHYYDNGILDPTRTYSARALYENQITVYPDSMKDGYRLEKVVGLPLQIAADDNANVIDVYYVSRNDTDYIVRYYYQEDGVYPEKAIDDTRMGTTDDYAEVTADDKIPKKPGYILDENAGNIFGGIVIADYSNSMNILVLKVYFKQQFTVTYEPGTYGNGIFNPSVTDGLDYGSSTPEAPITALGTPGTGGYVFAGWEPKVDTTVTKDATYVAQWIPSDGTRYTVEFYYENAGKYPAKPDAAALRAGTTDAMAAVTDSDKAAPNGYVLDPNASNVFEASITGDGNMVLKLYFKQQFTVTYNPGEHGSFDVQNNSGLSYGDRTPAFSGQTTANGSYSFNGWDKEIADTVTGNVVYTAVWSYHGGGSSGGGGGSNGGNPGRVTPTVDNGPGASVTINPEDVPLAQLPGAPVDTTTVIDDGEIPLAALPKTGQGSVKSTFTMMMSGVFLMLAAMSKKRKEEDS